MKPILPVNRQERLALVIRQLRGAGTMSDNVRAYLVGFIDALDVVETPQEDDEEENVLQ